MLIFFFLSSIDPMNHLKISKGQKVIVLEFSQYKRGCFTVEYSKNLRFDIPQHFVEQQTEFNNSNSTTATTANNTAAHHNSHQHYLGYGI